MSSPPLGTPFSADDIRLHPPFAEIWNRLERLPRQQRRLAEACLIGPELVAFSSLREISERIHVNPATIVRFAQSLGYEGYVEFQNAVRLAYKQRAGFAQTPTDLSAALRSSTEAVDFMHAQHVKSVEAAYRNVVGADLAAIGDGLEAARRIFVFAEASAQVPGLLFVHLLRHVMLHGELLSAEVEAMIALHDITPNDIVVFFGLGLTFRATLNVHEFVHARGAKTLAVIGAEVSPLRSRADHVIVAPSESPTMRFSVVAAINVVELLFTYLVSRRRGIVFSEQGTLQELYETLDLVAPLDR